MSNNGYNTNYDSDQDVTSLSVLNSRYGSDLINGDPSIDGPNLKLGNGQAYQFSGNTTLPGKTTTGWEEVQWSAPGYFTPTAYVTNHTDSLLGQAVGYWKVGDSTNNANLGVYGTSGAYVYQMGGASDGSYSNNTFIQTTNIGSGYTFDHKLTFTANEGIKDMPSTFSGVFMVDNAFTVTYSDHGHLYGFFLQVQLADSRGEPEYYNTVGSNYEKIFNATTNVGFTGPTSAVEYLPWNNNYSSSLHTVTINVNEAVLAMAQAFAAASPNLSASDILDMKNWSLSGSYVGIEDEGSTASFDLQNPELHYDSSSSFSSEDTGEQIATIQGVGYIDSIYQITTSSGSDTDITINGYQYASERTSQTVISNGNWDSINVNGKTAEVYVNKGASFDGENGTLTESGPGNIYVAGTYAGLYMTTGASSNINATLTGNGAINNNGSNVSITGSNAGLTLNGNGIENIVGIYSGLVINNFYQDDNMYAENYGSSYINNNGGNVNLTSHNDVVAYTNSGHTNITGVNAGNFTLDSSGSANYNITGTWNSMQGIFSQNGTVNITTKNASIYNDGGNINLTGNNGNLIYNSNCTVNENAEITGNWESVVATLQVSENIFATVGSDSYLTMKNGSKGNIWNPNGTNVNIFDSSDQNVAITYGEGSTNVYLDASKSALVNINDYHDTNGLLVLTGITKNDMTVSYNNNVAVVKASSGYTIDINNGKNITFGDYGNNSVIIHSS